ncbi:hypothetical protein FOCC_FOCC000518 [Frankliniella occidentalis]|nr:hypothetical protein FOCC_FOCC000518 [Frankliniella occidentalis]
MLESILKGKKLRPSVCPLKKRGMCPVPGPCVGRARLSRGHVLGVSTGPKKNVEGKSLPK